MVRLTDRPDMTLDVYHGRKTTMQQLEQPGPELLSAAALLVSFKRILGRENKHNLFILSVISVFYHLFSC